MIKIVKFGDGFDMRRHLRRMLVILSWHNIFERFPRIVAIGGMVKIFYHRIGRVFDLSHMFDYYYGI